MKRIFFLSALLVFAGLFFSGCAKQSQLNRSSNQVTSSVKQKKVGDTVKTGKISQMNDKYFITPVSGQPEEIDSYNVKLQQYVGKTITVVGQYSGDTLFVGKIKE